MGRTIGLRRIWSFVLGFRSLVARLAPFKRESEQKWRIFWQRKVWTANFSATMVRQDVWREKRKVRFFLARDSVNSQQLCEFLAWESVNSSPILARKWWRHFRLSLFLSLALSLYLSLSPSVPHAQYRKRFRASYNIVTDIVKRFRQVNEDNRRGHLVIFCDQPVVNCCK